MGDTYANSDDSLHLSRPTTSLPTCIEGSTVSSRPFSRDAHRMNRQRFSAKSVQFPKENTSQVAPRRPKSSCAKFSNARINRGPSEHVQYRNDQTQHRSRITTPTRGSRRRIHLSVAWDQPPTETNVGPSHDIWGGRLQSRVRHAVGETVEQKPRVRFPILNPKVLEHPRFVDLMATILENAGAETMLRHLSTGEWTSWLGDIDLGVEVDENQVLTSPNIK